MTKSGDLAGSVNPDSIPGERLVGLSVSSEKIADGSITNSKIDAAAAISAAKLQFLQAGAAADPRSVQSKLRDVVSVKDFGAVGDGVADDTQAIQDAINAVNIGTVFFPAGAYKTTAKIYTSYGKPIRLEGSMVYGNVSIVAHHADHVFQYNYITQIEGVGFFRDAAYEAAAKAAQKNGIHSDDTGGAIEGAAYTFIKDCVSRGHYCGIRMHGTHQFAENNVSDNNVIGMLVLGSVHTLIHNATENNTETALYIQGNGHRVLTHYADGNCSSGTAERGAITLRGDMCYVNGLQLNDNNGAPHIYIDRGRWNLVHNANFYITSARVTIRSAGGDDSFYNKFDIRYPGTYTIVGNSYHNFFPDGWVVAGAPTNYNPTAPELPIYKAQHAWGNAEIGAGQEVFLEASPSATFDQARLAMANTPNNSSNLNIEIIGAQLRVYGDGSAQTVDVKLKVSRNIPGFGRSDTTIVAIPPDNYPFGTSVAATCTQFNPIKLGVNDGIELCFALENNSAIPLKGAAAIVYYRFKTNQPYV